MNRIDRANKKLNELFGTMPAESADLDPEFTEISQRFIYGEIFCQGNLDVRLRMLISIVALTTIRNQTYLASLVRAALAVGVEPQAIKEALYQCAPFIGFASVFDALHIANAALLAHDVVLPLETARSVTEEERFDVGKAIQFPIYGDRIWESLENVPDEQRSSIPRYLTEVCFGDLYTRAGLDLQTRELLILCVLCALGNTQVQITSHAVGNLKVGNSRETIIAAVTQCLPWIGFPRTLNAIRLIKDITIE